MEETYVSKYHRKEPIRKFDVDQSMYDLVKNVNEKNMNNYYSNYFGFKKKFNQLINEADKLAKSLKNVGVNENDKVGVCLLTTPEVSSVLLSINKINAISYWMDASVGEEDMIKYINNHDIKVLFLFEPLYEMFSKIIDKTKLEKVILVKPFQFVNNPFKHKNDDERFIDYSSFIEDSKKYHGIVVPKYDRERPTVIVQSSGSTGKSKSIVHTDYNFNSEIEKMAYGDLPFYVGKKGFVCAPPWVIYGLVNSIYSGMVFGNETIFSLKPDEQMLYENLGKYDFAYGVPVYLRYLYKKMIELEMSNNRKDKYELNSLKRKLEKVKFFISGGDKLTEEEVINWQQTFDTPIINGYGNNEVVGAAIYSPMYANKPGSVGIPLHGNIVKTFDENGNILDDGQIGEIYISSNALFKEYLNNIEETNENKIIFDEKEWVRTGDLGYVDKDGYVYITGRKKRLIIDKLGYKISPTNSENIIQSLPYVAECVVVGVEIGPNDTVPMAFIELKNEYKNNDNKDDLMNNINYECSKHLKEYERPKLFKEISAMPHKSNGGKVDFKLLEEYAKEYVNSQNDIKKLKLK